MESVCLATTFSPASSDRRLTVAPSNQKHSASTKNGNVRIFSRDGCSILYWQKRKRPRIACTSLPTWFWDYFWHSTPRGTRQKIKPTYSLHLTQLARKYIEHYRRTVGPFSAHFAIIPLMDRNPVESLSDRRGGKRDADWTIEKVTNEKEGDRLLGEQHHNHHARLCFGYFGTRNSRQPAAIFRYQKSILNTHVKPADATKRMRQNDDNDDDNDWI